MCRVLIEIKKPDEFAFSLIILYGHLIAPSAKANWRATQ